MTNEDVVVACSLSKSAAGGRAKLGFASPCDCPELSGK